MADYSAISPGADLPQLARELVRVHDAVLSGSRTATPPRPVVARSWSRVLELGLDPDSANTRDPFPLGELERRRRESPLHLVVDDIRAVTGRVADASRFIMVVTDADGVILWREGSAGVLRTADRLGFAEGALWTEARVGTNAIGTALAEETPVQLFSAEHFEHAQHPWYCTAWPIHDPRSGDLLGIVDVSGPAMTLHPVIGALVESAVRLAEAQLWRHHETRLERLRTASEHLLAAVSGPVLLVDDHGWVAHHAGVAARDRIGVPRTGTPLAVPGLGLCLPERVLGGWLVRPASGRTTIFAQLSVGDPPRIVVHGHGEPWQAALPRRHAQILQLLHTAGPAGLTAAQLSRHLFGDGEHLVSARAEVSRLRRVLGAVVATRPYRIADGVSLTLTAP
ncbi:MAG TPA: transcriptional regulator [Marmoricola sp.]|nr:transcriptional regulator [Marmoricola sp.]